MSTPIKTGYAPVNGLNMYYEIHGTGGTPLILLHGVLTTIDSSFGHVLPSLGQCSWFATTTPRRIAGRAN